MQAGASVVCRTKGPFLSTHNRVAAMDGMVENNMAKSAMMTMKDYFDPFMLVNWSGDPPALHMTTVL